MECRYEAVRAKQNLSQPQSHCQFLLDSIAPGRLRDLCRGEDRQIIRK